VANGKLAKASSIRRPKPPKLTAVPTAPVRAGDAERAPLDARLVDPQRLSQLEDIARDASFLSELIQGFVTDVDAILTRTERAIAAGDADALPDLMHSLKGAAVSVGATQLADLALDFETSSGDRSPDGVHGRLAAIRTCFDATRGCLRSYLQNHHHV
jgi:HPt (histidine-containing phosphotransfer) domain-containing protein